MTIDAHEDGHDFSFEIQQAQIDKLTVRDLYLLQESFRKQCDDTNGSSDHMGLAYGLHGAFRLEMFNRPLKTPEDAFFVLMARFEKDEFLNIVGCEEVYEKCVALAERITSYPRINTAAAEAS